MYEQLLPVVLVIAAVIFIMMKQINKVTTNIDSLANADFSKLYSLYAAVIQEKIRAIRFDVESFATSSNLKFSLLEGKELGTALERLSDMIRKLVFFETMMGKNKNKSETESELFAILNDLDNFINDSLKNGETIADEVKDELFNAYESLRQNITNISN